MSSPFSHRLASQLVEWTKGESDKEEPNKPCCYYKHKLLLIKNSQNSVQRDMTVTRTKVYLSSVNRVLNNLLQIC